MKNLLKVLLIICSLVSLNSCSKEEDLADKNSVDFGESEKMLSQEDKNRLFFYKETADLLGEIFEDASVKTAMIEFIKEEGEEFEAISMSQIASCSTNSSAHEILKKAFATEMTNEPSKYKLVSEFFNKAQLVTTAKEYDINPMDVEFYIPYNERFTSNDDITVTYDPIVRDDWNEGILYTNNNSSYVARVDDEYSQNNQTLMILPVDTTPESAYTPLKGKGDWGDSHIEGPAEPIGYSYINRGLLRTNMSSTQDIGHNDILITNVANIRLTDDCWGKFFATSIKLVIYRSSAPDIINLSTDESAISATTQKILYYKISKRDARNSVWQGGFAFDDNWNPHKAEQMVVFCTEHNEGAGDVNFEGTVGAGISDGELTFDADLTLDVNYSIEHDHTKVRQSFIFGRNSVLTSNVGGLGFGTYLHEGANLTIRKQGVVEFAFAFYHIEAIPVYE